MTAEEQLAYLNCVKPNYFGRYRGEKNSLELGVHWISVERSNYTEATTATFVKRKETNRIMIMNTMQTNAIAQNYLAEGRIDNVLCSMKNN